MKVTKRAAAIAPSLTLEITAKAKKMKEAGISVVSFGAGEPDFATPAPIVQAAIDALHAGFTKYTPASGTDDLKKAISEKLLRENGLDYSPSQIVVSSGAKHSLFNVFQAVVEVGDEVIMPSPYWLTYPELIRLAGGTPVFVSTKAENDFKITAEEFENAVTAKTKAIVLNSPNNPTGAVYGEEELKRLAEVAVRHDIVVISDEIYEKLVYHGKKHISIASLGKEIKDLTVVVNGVSKAFAMTGWRIGYLAAPENVAKAISGLQSHETSNPCSISQAASVAAFHSDDGSLAKMQKAFEERRDYIVSRAESIPGLSCIEPDGAFYLMLNVSSCYGKKYNGEVLQGSVSFCGALLKAEAVAAVPGISFGADDYIRLSYAISMEDIKEGMDRITRFVGEVSA